MVLKRDSKFQGTLSMQDFFADTVKKKRKKKGFSGVKQ